MFTDANWKALNLKKTRFFVEWNTIDQPAELAKADAFVAAARTAGVSVLMHISTDDINSQPRRPLPSNSAYKSKVGALVKRYRAQGVKDWGVWNEANHKSQPTAKNPKRAAEFYKTFRKFKCSGCKIVALDVLDQAGVEKYIASWIKAAGSLGKKAKIIGVHNYSQVNRRITEKNASNRYPGVARILKAIRKKNSVAKLWLTETGGLASFGSGFVCDRAVSPTARSTCSTSSRSTTRTSSACTATTTSATAARRRSTAASSKPTARRVPRTTRSRAS